MEFNKNFSFNDKIVPSIFAADFSNLLNQIKKIEDFGCKLIHLDIMDGHFVPNISYGPKITEDIMNVTNLKGDLHLMVEDPSFFIDRFLFEKIEFITFHIEASRNNEDAIKIIEKIKKIGKKAGVSLKPGTKEDKIEDILNLIDLVLVMTVEPGFSGQKMIEESCKKIEKLHDLKIKKNYKYLIEVDGGINFENAPSILNLGADLLVLGSAFFKI